MSHLTVLNGSGSIARSVVGAMKYSQVKIVDARPNRQSVYNWQRSLNGVGVSKCLARGVQSIDLALEGANDVVYFTHDYYTMASDKNSHLVATAKLAKKHGIKNFVAVCPIEQDLAWSEDQENFFEKSAEAEASALSANPNMTVLRSNLAFGPESHLVHYLAQCALVGKAPYKNLIDAKSTFQYAPIHTADIAAAVESAIQGGNKGWFSLNGSQKMTLRQMMDCIEQAAGKEPGSTKGPMLPPIMTEFIWDFMYGTGADLNMSRIVDFYEQKQVNLGTKPWTATESSVSFGDFYKSNQILEEEYAYPTLPSYKLQHTD